MEQKRDMEERALSLEEAMKKLREHSMAEPGEWRTEKTRRFGIHLSWKHTPDKEPADSLRIHREYVRPYSEDVIAVIQYLPKDLVVVDTDVIEPAERVRPLNKTAIEFTLSSRADQTYRGECTKCGRPRANQYPLIGEKQICPLCASSPDKRQRIQDASESDQEEPG